MAKVCEEWFPKGSFSGQQSDGFYMHNVLKLQLDALVKNIIYDWDFTIIISGSGQVRVGKSTLAAQIGCYLSYMVWKIHGIETKFSLKDNFVFDGTKLIEQGTMLGTKFPYSPLIYDEAGADLVGRKVMKAATQQVLDYFRECGQYNLFNILVIPEFFDLPATIGINRSKCLIDVRYSVDKQGLFKRGGFRFYSFPNKLNLYLRGKRTLNYNSYRPDFLGDFTQFFPLDVNEYKGIKQRVMKLRGNLLPNKVMFQRDALMNILHKKFGMTLQQIADTITEESTFSISNQAISLAIKGFPLRKGGFQAP